MSKFRSKLSRYNTICCDQVMPVPVIPVCAVSCCIPKPICEYKIPECIPQPPLQIPQYCGYLPDPPTGSILTISNTSVPAGYLVADGSEILRTTHSALFLVIGTSYGDGDGITTFNLPNLLSENSSNCVVSYIIKT